MQLDVEQIGDRVVMRPQGRMDALTAPQFESSYASIAVDGVVGCVVDMSSLEYISSAGLRSILAVAKRAKSENRSLCFCGVGGMVAEVFRVSGFERLFPLHSSLDQALGR